MSKKTFSFLLFIILIVNFVGLFGDIFSMDSSLYATISKSFSVSGDYINIYVNGEDWLDKPHFPFWVCAIFIDLFGASSFSYKLPSFLFFIVGLLFTYKLSKRLYNTNIAYLATLILGSSTHIFLSNNDVRAEAILLGLVMGATYYLYKLKLKFSLKAVILSSLFSAAAVMTKGIFILIIPYSAIFLEMLLKKEINKNLIIRFLIVLVLTFLFVIPEIYAVYQQFDLHPEKVVFGEKNVSGVKFLFWDSQFGRFFNTGPVTGKGDVSFYIHTTAWAFAPWAIIGFSSLAFTGKNILKKVKTNEYLTFFGFLIMFLIFSLSRFQLPHYVNILFPFISIMVAALILKNKNKWVSNTLKYSINAYCVVFLIVISLIEYFFRPDHLIIGLIILSTLLFLLLFTNTKKASYKHKFFILGVLSSSLFFLYLNLSFYPKLLKYQAGSQIAFHVNEYYPKDDITVSFNDNLLQYYTKNTLHNIETIDELKQEIKDKNKILAVDESFYANIQKSNLDFEVLKRFENYRVTLLTKNFFYHKTREKTFSYKYLIEVKTYVDKK